MRLSYKLLISAISAYFCFCVSFAQNNLIYINGSSSFDSILLSPYKDEIEKKTNVSLKIFVNGSEHGLRDLALGRCDIAMISGTLESLADSLNAQIPNLIQLDQYTSSKIGESSVVFIVNKKNPIDYLPPDTLRQICVGDIKNWKPLGGIDTRIILFTMQRGDGIRTTIQDELLKGDFFGVYTTMLRNSEVMNEIVAYIPGAIGTNNISAVNDSVKILKTDTAFTQPLILVSKANARPEVLAFINTLKDITADKLSNLKKN